MEAKEKSRQIESVDKRTVHFLFNSGVFSKISPFSRKFQYFLDGKIEEEEAKEKTAFEDYIERMQNDELEENEENPVKFGEMPYFHCELTGGLSRLCFSTADDPFCKASLAKFYPEVTVFDKNGTLISQINHK